MASPASASVGPEGCRVEPVEVQLGQAVLVLNGLMCSWPTMWTLVAHQDAYRGPGLEVTQHSARPGSVDSKVSEVRAEDLLGALW